MTKQEDKGNRPQYNITKYGVKCKECGRYISPCDRYCGNCGAVTPPKPADLDAVICDLCECNSNCNMRIRMGH